MYSTQINYKTLPYALITVAKSQPNLGYVFEENDDPEIISYSQLLSEALEWAGRWQSQGLQKGDKVILVMPTTKLFAPVYWSLLFCGAIPCILPSPTLIRGREIGIKRVRDVGLKLGVRFLITTQAEETMWVENSFPFEIQFVEHIATLPPSPFRETDIDARETAIIQATSGSTDQPKCIELTHANVLVNLYQCGERLQVRPGDVMVSWLPLFHDMGLIGGYLFPLFWQIQGVLIPPTRFIRRPVRWLQAITKYKGSISPAPNFAYALAIRRVSASEQATLDLSSWRSALCGAEPIDARVLHVFARRFQPSGFESKSLTPCYGLAEAALCVTMQGTKQPLNIETICRETAATDQRAIVVTSHAHGDRATTTLDVCDCGPPVVDTSIEIRDELGQVRQEGEIGRVWISSPSLMRGYVGEQTKTAETLQDGWLDTGDIGYLRNGNLFVIGRLKETIIIRGQNYYPTEFEQAAAQLPQIEMGKVVALGIYDEQEGSEQLHLVIETRAKGEDEELRSAVKEHIAQLTGIRPACVLLVPRHTITRTTSGKLQRFQLKMNYSHVQQLALATT